MNRAVQYFGALAVLVVMVLILSERTHSALDDVNVAGTVCWQIDANGVLTLTPVSGNVGHLEMTDRLYHTAPWYERREEIRAIAVPEGTIIVFPSESGRLFQDCVNLVDISGLARCDVSQVTDMIYLFSGCESLITVDALAGWDVRNVEIFSNLFLGCISLVDIHGLATWNTAMNRATAYCFCNCEKLSDFSPIAHWYMGRDGEPCYMFSGCKSLSNLDFLASWEASGMVIMSGMFQMCPLITNVDACANWNTVNVDSMDYMFAGCENLKSIEGIRNWNTGKVKTMNSLFKDCASLESIDAVSDWNVESVEDMMYLFAGCKNLPNVDGVNHWRLTNVSHMSWAFRDCVSLRQVDTSDWTLNDSVKMDGLFKGCDLLEQITLGENLSQHMFSLKTSYEDEVVETWSRVDGTYVEYEVEDLARNYTADMAGVWQKDPPKKTQEEIQQEWEETMKELIRNRMISYVRQLMLRWSYCGEY